MTTRDLYEKACLEWALKHTDLLFNSEHYIKKYPRDIHEDEKDEEDRAFDLDQGHFYDDELYHWHNILCEAAAGSRPQPGKPGAKLCLARATVLKTSVAPKRPSGPVKRKTTKSAISK